MTRQTTYISQLVQWRFSASAFCYHPRIFHCPTTIHLTIHPSIRPSIHPRIPVVRAFAHGAMGLRIDPSWGGPIELFSFQPVLHDWCNKGRGMCYPVCGMVHIKEPLLLIGKSNLCGGSGFALSLSELSLTICLTPYNSKKCVEYVVK